MSGTENGAEGSMSAQGVRQLRVLFEFATTSQLVTGDRITGFPSYVVGGMPEAETSIVIDTLPDASDRTVLQQAISRRTAQLATVAQALGLASSELAEAMRQLNAGT